MELTLEKHWLMYSIIILGILNSILVTHNCTFLMLITVQLYSNCQKLMPTINSNSLEIATTPTKAVLLLSGQTLATALHNDTLIKYTSH